MELSEDILQCANLVKQGDYERYRVIMTLDPKFRSDLFVLMAANIEISRAPWASRESLISEIRLRWWLEAIEEIESDKAVRRHFVTSPLEDILSRSQSKLIKENITARSWDINTDPHLNERELFNYINRTSGNIWAVAAELLGGSQKIGRLLGMQWVLFNIAKRVRNLLKEVGPRFLNLKRKSFKIFCNGEKLN